jgi:hypothetical protein
MGVVGNDWLMVRNGNCSYGTNRANIINTIFTGGARVQTEVQIVLKIHVTVVIMTPPLYSQTIRIVYLSYDPSSIQSDH